ncbi:2-haloacid dehalogenase [Micromonospora sp. Llam0]|nr:2-haloacid dehalogenase [Micromonospora sp. Llam0]
MNIAPVDAVVFDVNETLFTLDRLRPAFTDAGLDPSLVPVWFARLLRDGFALTALGSYRPFAEVAAETLRRLGASVEDDAVAMIVATMRDLDPHPDVEPALRALRDAGIATATLTNGSVEVVQALLHRANLGRYLSANLSVDAVRRWKPAAEPYRFAATELAVDPGSLALVAAHPGDCAGATAAGLRAAWVNRAGQHWPAIFQAAGFSAPDRATLVDALLATRR